MFNLENAISEWQQQMLAAGIKTPAPLTELEGHLREEIEEQMKAGWSEAEAFRFAAQKVGLPRPMQKEFEKVEDAEEQRKRKEGRIWAVVILGLLQLVTVGFALFNSEMTLGQRISSVAAMAMSLALVGVVGLSYRLFPVIRDKRTRTVVSVFSGGVPTGIWMLILGRYFLAGHEFPYGQWLTDLFWISCPPLGVSLGVTFGFETAAEKMTRNTQPHYV